MDWLSFLSPFLIVLMSTIILYGLIRIGKRLDEWRFYSLGLIPAIFIVLYSWIGIFQPSVTYARMGLRIALMASLAIGLHVTFSFMSKLKQEEK